MIPPFGEIELNTLNKDPLAWYTYNFILLLGILLIFGILSHLIKLNIIFSLSNTAVVCFAYKLILFLGIPVAKTAAVILG